MEDVRKAIVSGAERFEVGGRYPLQAAAVQLARMGVVSFFRLEGYADSVQIPTAPRTASPMAGRRIAAAPGLFFSATPSRAWNRSWACSRNARRALISWRRCPTWIRRVGRERRQRRRHADVHPGALDDRPGRSSPGDGRHEDAGGCTCENADYLRIDPANRDRVALGAAAAGHDDGGRLDEALPETGFPAMQKVDDARREGQRAVFPRRSSPTTTTTSPRDVRVDEQALEAGAARADCRRGFQAADAGRGDSLDQRASGAGERRGRRTARHLMVDFRVGSGFERVAST